MTKTRVLAALIMAPLAIGGVLFLPTPWLVAIAALLFLLALWEWLRLADVEDTLARTILTSTTVFLAVLMLLVFGGGAINNFAVLFVIGIITGTYSTVFIATPVMLAWYKGRRPGLAAAK